MKLSTALGIMIAEAVIFSAAIVIVAIVLSSKTSSPATFDHTALTDGIWRRHNIAAEGSDSDEIAFYTDGSFTHKEYANCRFSTGRGDRPGMRTKNGKWLAKGQLITLDYGVGWAKFELKMDSFGPEKWLRNDDGNVVYQKNGPTLEEQRRLAKN